MRCTCHRPCLWRSFSVLRASRSLALAWRSCSFRMCSLVDFFTASETAEAAERIRRGRMTIGRYTFRMTVD